MQWLDERLLGPEDNRWVVVIGGLGVGKSAILSQWIARHDATTRIPHHFIRGQVTGWAQPEVIACSLSAQLEVMFPDLCDPDAKPERRLLELLGRLSKQLGSSGRLVIVVDGLDETCAEAGENPLLRFLPAMVPNGIRFLCSTRPLHLQLSWFDAQSSVRRLKLDSSQWAASNEFVVREYWNAVAPEYQPPLPDETKSAAIGSAAGNMMHAVLLRGELHDRLPDERRGDRIPSGLELMIDAIWTRATSHDEVRVGLGLLCAAQEALPLATLGELAEWSFQDKQRFAREARQLVIERPATWAGVEGYRLSNDWVRELVKERLDAEVLRGHHRTLVCKLATWPPPVDPARQTYALRYALAHRLAMDDWAGVRELASNLGYLEASAHATDVFAMEQSLADAARRCPDPLTARDLGDLARALARESHWVRDNPNGTAGLLWNRLRRSGWTAKELQARITLPDDATFLRARHASSIESEALERSFERHTGGVTACVLLRDGRRVLSASDDCTLKLWDLDDGRALATLHGHTAVVMACAVTPDGRRAVSASSDCTLRIWNLETARSVAVLEGHIASVNACAITPDGERIVSGAADGTIKVWSLSDGRVLDTIAGHTMGVTACAAMSNGRVVTASADQTLRIWHLDPVRTIATLEGHTAWVNACAVMPDGRIISGSDDGSVRIWGSEGGNPFAVFENLGDGVTSCVVTANGQRAICALQNGVLKVLELDTGAAAVTLRGHSRIVSGCAVTSDGRRVVSASFDGTLKVWDLLARRVTGAFDGHADQVSGCAVTPDGKRVITASHDRTLKIWDVGSGRVQETLAGHRNWVNACALMPDGRHVISASSDATLRVWDLDDKRELARMENNHMLPVHICIAMPDGRRIVSAGHDGVLAIWDVVNAEVEARIDLDVGTACAVTRDGSSVIACTRDGAFQIHDLRSGASRALDGHSEEVTACAITPDGRCLVAASQDATIRVQDLGSGEIRAVLRGHTRTVTACTVTPDGQYVVSVSNDRTLKLWDITSARCLCTHRGDAAFSCVSATATDIIAGDHAGTVWFLASPSSASQRASRRRGDKRKSEVASQRRRGRRR